MGDETLFAAMALPVVVGPILEKVNRLLLAYMPCVLNVSGSDSR